MDEDKRFIILVISLIVIIIVLCLMWGDISQFFDWIISNFEIEFSI